jgi:lipid-A-disaccharide synthase
MRYYIIAGERSGDLHGSNLVKALKKLDPVAEFRGIGGEYMKEAGVQLSIDYGDMAFMGFIEVFMNLRTISKYVNLSRRDIMEYKPDVVILIDYAGFNRQMASFCKKNNIKVFYYISPKVLLYLPESLGLASEARVASQKECRSYVCHSSIRERLL